jgi:hypothetical protein
MQIRHACFVMDATRRQGGSRFREHKTPARILNSMTYIMKRTAAVWLAATMALGTWSCGATTLSTGAIADAFVATGSTGSLSSSNFGGAGALAVSAGNLPQGEFQSVVKFDLSGVASSFNALYGAGLWTVESVTLQLSASPHNNAIFNNIAAGQFDVSLMQNNSWVEGTGSGGKPTSDGISINSLRGTYINNATDQALGTFSFAGGSSGTANYALNLSSSLINDLLTGNEASLRLFAADNQVSYLFSSHESGPAPTLVIDVMPEPGTLAIFGVGMAVFVVKSWKKNGGAGTKADLRPRTFDENNHHKTFTGGADS